MKSLTDYHTVGGGVPDAPQRGKASPYRAKHERGT